MFDRRESFENPFVFAAFAADLGSELCRPLRRHTVGCLKSFQSLERRQLDISGSPQRCFRQSPVAKPSLGLTDAPALGKQIELPDRLILQLLSSYNFGGDHRIWGQRQRDKYL
jgi:hypothetical protein